MLSAQSPERSNRVQNISAGRMKSVRKVLNTLTAGVHYSRVHEGSRKSGAVRALSAQFLRAEAHGLSTEQRSVTVNNTGKWSEMPNSDISVMHTSSPWESSKSSVWPFSCVGPVTHWVKLKESIIFKKSLTRSLESQQTWMLKSPRQHHQKT